MSIFEDNVHKFFAPVAERFGLQCTETSRNCVKFSGDEVYFSVVYDDRRSSEIIVYFGLVRCDLRYGFRTFDLSDLVRIAKSTDIGFAMVADPEVLVRVLERLERSVEVHGSEFLRGNIEVYAATLQNIDQRAREIEEHKQKERHRQIARNAWSVGDYGTVVNAYEALGDVIRPSEQKRMEIARKRLHPHGAL